MPKAKAKPNKARETWMCACFCVLCVHEGGTETCQAVSVCVGVCVCVWGGRDGLQILWHLSRESGWLCFKQRAR